MSQRHLFCLSIAALAVVLGLRGESAWAQTRGNTGSNPNAAALSALSSMFGGSTGSAAFGSGMTGGLSGSGLSGGGLGGGSGMGGGGLGGGTGMGGQGQGGLGGAAGFGQNQNAGGFIGRNMNANQFIGRTAQGTAGQTGQTGRGARGGGQRGLDPDLQNILNNSGGAGQANPRTQGIRPRQKVAFEYPSLPSNQVSTTLKTRLEKLSQRHPQLSSVDLAMEDGGTAVLTGTVASADAARLAENLIRIEPGVSRVRNELTYPPPSPE